jgi:hypothetical protein
LINTIVIPKLDKLWVEFLELAYYGLLGLLLTKLF